jgi:hypothetical protein
MELQMVVQGTLQRWVEVVVGGKQRKVSTDLAL